MYIPAKDSRAGLGLFKIPRCRLNSTLEGFKNQSIRLLNILPQHIRAEENTWLRKRMLKAWVREAIAPQV